MDVTTHKTQLITIAGRHDWEYGPDFLEVKNEATANLLLHYYANDLLLIADKKGHSFRVRWGHTYVDIPPGCGTEALEEIRQQALNEDLKMSELLLPELASIQFGNIKLGRAMLETIIQFLDDPSVKRGVVRRSDNKQLILTDSSKVLVDDGDLTKAVTRKREDYWHMPDLEEFMRESRQRLEPNNFDSQLEWSWRSFDPDTGGDWLIFTNSYRLIEDNGVLYEVSTNMDVHECEEPVS